MVGKIVRMSREKKVNLIAATLLLSATALVIPKRRIRRFGVKPFLKRRPLFGQYEKMFVYLKDHDEKEFFAYTRMTPKSFDYLLSIIEPDLIKDSRRKNAIPPAMRLALTLHFLAEGHSMREIARNFHIGHSTTHYIIRETCTFFLWDRLINIVMPNPTKEDFKKISNGFWEKWNFPNCIGALDGKHCSVQAPYHSGSDYFSYKTSFSIVLMATCDSQYRFTMVDIGAQGSAHDSSVFKESGFGKALLENKLPIPEPVTLPNSNTLLPFCLIADQAFPLHENIMRPYPGDNLPENNKIFNYRLSRARRTIENTFGILSQRWRCLRHAILGDVFTCEAIIKACVILHNFVQKEEENIPMNNRQYCPPGFTDSEDTNGDMVLGMWRKETNPLRPVGRLGANNANRQTKNNRDKLKDYFVSPEGAVEWQLEQIFRGSLPL